MPYKPNFVRIFAPGGVKHLAFAKLTDTGMLYWRITPAVTMPGGYTTPARFRRITRMGNRDVEEAIRDTAIYLEITALSQETAEYLLDLLYAELGRRVSKR